MVEPTTDDLVERWQLLCDEGAEPAIEALIEARPKKSSRK